MEYILIMEIFLINFGYNPYFVYLRAVRVAFYLWKRVFIKGL
jgi:hypothetical protein